jgi:hypothetical protein
VGNPVSLLQGARAFARDFARDAMPQGYLWDVCDFVPQIIDASLTGRGGWIWQTNAPLGGDVESGILAKFLAGEQLLVQDTSGRVSQIDTTSGAITDRGAMPRAIQNPIQVFDQTVWFDGSALKPPQLLGSAGAPANIDASAPPAKYGTVWGGYIMVAGKPGFEDTVYFGPPGPKTSGAWDANAFQETDNVVTGLAALRSIGLIFHASSVERLRGTTAPNTAAGDPGDLVLEPLFRRVGCPDARAIAYWNENVIFADEHGVHITDGAVVRNLANQGGISYYWRPLYQNHLSLAAEVFLDYYLISVVRSDGTNDTLICDLNSRQWFRFSNIAAISYISSGGSIGMERIWAGIKGTSQLARVSACFAPSVTTVTNVDANGTNVMPFFETPWYRVGPEGRKRMRFAYLSYDARVGTGKLSDHPAGWRAPLEGEVPEESIVDTLPDVISLGYIRSPQDPSYTALGNFPATTEYLRFRLPVNQQPYGIAFHVAQMAPTTVLRVFDFALELLGAERSRL